LKATFGEDGKPIITLSKTSGNPAVDEKTLRQAREKLERERAWKGAKPGDSIKIIVDFNDSKASNGDRPQERRSITVSEPVSEPTASETPEIPTTSASPLPPSKQSQSQSLLMSPNRFPNPNLFLSLSPNRFLKQSPSPKQNLLLSLSLSLKLKDNDQAIWQYLRRHEFAWLPRLGSRSSFALLRHSGV